MAPPKQVSPSLKATEVPQGITPNSRLELNQVESKPVHKDFYLNQPQSDQVTPRQARQKPKNKDLSFPIVYFGFILGFLAWGGDEIFKDFPSLETHLQGQFIPDPDTWWLPIVSLFVVCPILAVWRSTVKKYVFSRWAENWAGLQPGTVKYDKFLEQGWLAVHYTIAATVGVVVLKDKKWWPPAVSEQAMLATIDPLEEKRADQRELGLNVLYSMQLGFYSLELVTLLVSKHRRSDAAVYFFHHIYTLLLMIGSWLSYNHRIGTLVLFLHDIGDIFLPIGKCYTYAEEHIRATKTKAQYEVHKAIGMGSFIIFVIAFAIPRLLLFGSMVYQGIFKYRWYRCNSNTWREATCIPTQIGDFWPTSLVLLMGLLYPMHVFWFYLIVKMAIRLLLQPGEYEDVRSDDEKED